MRVLVYDSERLHGGRTRLVNGHWVELPEQRDGRPLPSVVVLPPADGNPQGFTDGREPNGEATPFYAVDRYWVDGAPPITPDAGLRTPRHIGVDSYPIDFQHIGFQRLKAHRRKYYRDRRVRKRLMREGGLEAVLALPRSKDSIGSLRCAACGRGGKVRAYGGVLMCHEECWNG